MAAAVTAAVMCAFGAIVATPLTAQAEVEPTGVIGGPAHALVYPSGLEVGPSGEIVMADTGNDGVVKFAPDGTLIWRQSTFASSADSLENSRDIAVGGDGSIYVADDAKFRIVKLNSSGTPVGAAWNGPPGDRIGSPIGISEKNGLIYVADGAKKKVRVFNSTGTQIRTMATTGVCTFAALRDVDADDAGNVYIANYTSNNILKLTANGTCVTKWGTMGTGDGQFKNPYGVRVANDPVWGESVYVADSNNNRIQVFSTSGVFRGKAGTTGGVGQNGTFTTLRRVAVAANGDIWGADLWGWKAVRFARSGPGYQYAQTIGGTPPVATSTSVFNEPRALAVSGDGTLNVVDTVNQRVVTMSPGGAVTGTCGARTNLPTSPNWPRGVAIDPVSGDRWIADTKQSRIQIWAPNCSVTARVGAIGAGTGQFNWPYAIAIRPGDRTAFVADTKNNRIVAWDVASRTQLQAFGSLGAGTGQFNSPRGLSVTASSGNLLVSDSKNNRVVELSYSRGAGFSVVRSLTSGFNTPEGAAQDSTGKIWVSDTLNNRVVVLNNSGTVSQTITVGATKALNGPTSVTAVPGKVYVSDTQNDRVLAYAAGGGVTIPPTQAPAYVSTVLGEGVADMYPVDVADTATHYYVVDPGRYRVVGVNRTTGAVDYTVGGVQGNSNTQFAAARAIATGDDGSVYVADTPNNRIQKFSSTLAFQSTWGIKGTANGQFNQVYGVATGPGKGAGGADTEVVYTIDADRVQKFTTGGTHLATFGGGGTLSQPRQIDVNQVNGDIYVVSARSHQIVVYNNLLVEQRRFGSLGSGDGQFQNDPRGVTVSRDGQLVFVTDDGGRRVEAFTTAGVYLYSMGTATSGTDSFVDPRGIQATDDGHLLVADEWSYSLKEYDVTATGATFVRKLFGAAPPQSGVNSPRGMEVDANGRLYVSDWWNQRIVRTNGDGSGFLSWGQRGTRADPGSLNFAWDMAVQPGTGRVFVANRESHEITVFDADGVHLTKWGIRGTELGRLQFPQGLKFAPDGTLVVADSGNDRIQRFSIDAAGNGTFVESLGALGTAPGQFNMLTGIDVAADGTIWVADTLNNRVQSYDPATSAWTVFTRPGGTGSLALKVPWGITVAPDGAIWVADTGNNRIVKMTPAGVQQFAFTGTSAGTTAFNAPFGVAFGALGEVYVSDTWNNRVVEFGWS